MGGEPSKHTSSPNGGRVKNPRRSGVSNALAGGDCRNTSTGKRSAPVGPTYGDVPEHISLAPVRCAAVPIAPTAVLDASLTWIPDTESSLITEWNRQRQDLNVARGTKAKSTNTNSSRDAGMTSQGEASLSPPPESHNGNRSASPTTATPFTNVAAPSKTAIPLACDPIPAATGRSTGLVFQVPTAWGCNVQRDNVALGSSHLNTSRSSSTTTSPKVPVDKHGSCTKFGNGASPPTSPLQPPRAPPSVIISQLPVGIEYYQALQSSWLTPATRAMPPATEEEDLNDSTILEAVADADGDVLSPPVPLAYMIDLFVPQWRAEGLFEQAEISNQQR